MAFSNLVRGKAQDEHKQGWFSWDKNDKLGSLIIHSAFCMHFPITCVTCCFQLSVITVLYGQITLFPLHFTNQCAREKVTPGLLSLLCECILKGKAFYPCQMKMIGKAHHKNERPITCNSWALCSPILSTGMKEPVRLRKTEMKMPKKDWKEDLEENVKDISIIRMI